MMLWLPGSSVMRPVVHTVRGPQISGKRLSIAESSRTSASPASRRRVIEVVPAWFCSPVTVNAVLPDRHDRRDDADAQLLAFERVALLDVRLEEAL